MTKKIEDPIVLESGKEITSAGTTVLGSTQRPVLYTNFLLHLSTQFAGATSDSQKIQYVIQYSPDGGTTWYDYLIGYLGSLIYNKNQVATADWVASTAYAVGDRVLPTTPNGYYYQCTVAGTSGASEPTWPTNVGATVTDGGVAWRCEAETEMREAISGTVEGQEWRLRVKTWDGTWDATDKVTVKASVEFYSK